MRSQKPINITEITAVATLIIIAAAVRFHRFFCAAPTDLMTDELRLGLSAQTILKKCIIVFNYYQSSEPPLPQYFTALPVFFWGLRPWTVRLAPVLFSLAAIVLTYLAARRLFSSGAAIIAAGFAAILPSFVFWGRVAYGSSFLVVSVAAVLYLHSMSLQTGKKRFLYATALVLGLGFSTNLSMLYVFTSFLAALFISGHYKKYALAPWSLVKASLCFFAGAGFLITYMALSDKLLIHMLKRSQADTMILGAHNFLTAVIERIEMAQSYFTWILFLPFIYWPLAFLSKRAVSGNVVFVGTFFLGFLLQSVFTWSGLYAEHLTVALPLAAVMVGSLSDLPGLRMLWSSKILNSFLVVFFTLFIALSGWVLHFRDGLPSMTGAGCAMTENSLSRAFAFMDPGATIHSKSQYALMHWFISFEKQGRLPDVHDAGITSSLCNRFHPCPAFSDIHAVDILYTLHLRERNMLELCSDTKNDRFYFNKPRCSQELQMFFLNHMNENAIKNIVLCQGDSHSDPFYMLNKGILNAVDALEREGLIVAERESMDYALGKCVIIRTAINRKQDDSGIPDVRNEIEQDPLQERRDL
jgi:hypothetical protein